MRVQEKQKNNVHVLCINTTSREMSRTNVDLNMSFVDLTTAFDTVSRDGLWKIITNFGCQPSFINMVRTWHADTLQIDGEYSEPLLVTNGVKKGCVMATTLFSMIFFCHAPRCFLGLFCLFSYQVPV